MRLGLHTPADLVDVFARFGLEAKVIPNVIDLATFLYRERSRVRPAAVEENYICWRRVTKPNG
jgi:hypothetical protein